MGWKRWPEAWSERQMVEFFVRMGRWVIVGLAAAIVGLAATFSGDANVAFGRYILYAGSLVAIDVFDFLVLAVALWSWKQSRFVAGFPAFAFAVTMTASVLVALFLNLPQVRDTLFLVAIPMGLLAPIVQALQERRRKFSGEP